MSKVRIEISAGDAVEIASFIRVFAKLAKGHDLTAITRALESFESQLHDEQNNASLLDLVSQMRVNELLRTLKIKQDDQL